jgi:hypothetical protein
MNSSILVIKKMPKFKSKEEYEKWKAARLESSKKDNIATEQPKATQKKKKLSKIHILGIVVGVLIVFLYIISDKPQKARRSSERSQYSESSQYSRRSTVPRDMTKKTSGELRVISSDVLACQELQYFEKSHKAALQKDYATASNYPPPPICIDLYVGQKLDGPFDEKRDNVLSLEYIKVQIGDKYYWLQKGSVSD